MPPPPLAPPALHLTEADAFAQRTVAGWNGDIALGRCTRTDARTAVCNVRQGQGPDVACFYVLEIHKSYSQHRYRWQSRPHQLGCIYHGHHSP